MLLCNIVGIIGVVCLTSLTGAVYPGALRRPPDEFFVAQTSTQKSDRVEIRIRNDSDLDFDSVRVHFPEGRDVDYGPVPKGGSSGFQAIGRAYRYAGLSVKAGKKELSLQPIDYLGEKELPAGRYAYALGVDNGRLTIQLEKVN
jgi:hypothetical protein